jgi:ubiquinone/menaquinone biosynthesis C-methylase UbiE
MSDRTDWEDSMDKPMSDFHFRIMSLMFKVRDLFSPRENILNELDIKPEFQILDYGCGPGSYTFVASKLVGAKGRVYALDIHPLAIQRVKSTALRKGLRNIETIQSDCATGLESETIDVTFLYDILHDLMEPDRVLGELHRVLKPGGILSCNDHHMKENQVISRITETGLFTLSNQGKKTYNFSKSKGGR